MKDNLRKIPLDHWRTDASWTGATESDHYTKTAVSRETTSARNKKQAFKRNFNFRAKFFFSIFGRQIEANRQEYWTYIKNVVGKRKTWDAHAALFLW